MIILKVVEHLIIFPEGTRVPYGMNIKIKKGVLKILSSLKVTINYC